MIPRELVKYLETESKSALISLEKEAIDYRIAQLYVAVVELESAFDCLFQYELESITNEDIQQLINTLSQNEDGNIFLALAEENSSRSTPANLADGEECWAFISEMIERCKTKI